jgi:hypothetical protein
MEGGEGERDGEEGDRERGGGRWEREWINTLCLRQLANPGHHLL